MTNDDTWTLAGRTFTSRIIVGTGKYATLDLMDEALAATARDHGLGIVVDLEAVRRCEARYQREGALSQLAEPGAAHHRRFAEPPLGAHGLVDLAHDAIDLLLETGGTGGLDHDLPQEREGGRGKERWREREVIR